MDEFLTSSATFSPMRILMPSRRLDLAMVKSQSKRGRGVVGGFAVSPTAFSISTTGARPFLSSSSATTIFCFVFGGVNYVGSLAL